ncbi:MAG: hypothetical protein ACJZ7A_05950 [Opitutales bacterium]
MEITNICGDDLSRLDTNNQQSPLSASFDQNQGDGNGEYYNHPPTASHFSRKRHSLDLLPGLQDALQSLRDGDVRHHLQNNVGVISRPIMRNILPALA